MKKKQEWLRWMAVTLAASGVAAGGGAAWPGPPSTAAPKPAEAGGPPPAWLETTAASRWLAFGSYCWRTACADYIPPSQRLGLPQLTVRRGARVRLHVRFVPSSLGLRFLPSNRVVRLPPARVTVWRASTGGVVSVEAKGAGGSASYVLRLRLR